MKLFLSLLLAISTFSADRAKPYGSCTHKLLATGERAEDTVQFTMYLELLMSDRTIQAEDLDLFIQSLDQGQLINPIRHKDASKELAFHHDEFESLISSKNLDLLQIKEWIKSFVKKTEEAENQKKESKRDTELLPFYISYDKAYFYKFNHPVLGEAIKILKPNGVYSRLEDWEPVVWSVVSLKDPRNITRRGKSPNLHMAYGDNYNPSMMCSELGEDVSLASKNDYINLIKHFERRGYALTKNGRDEFFSVFDRWSMSDLWTSTPDSKNKKYQWVFNNDVEYRLKKVLRDELNSSICVGRMKEIWSK